jgi:mannose-1-phosphate guanylyltransferase
VKAFILAAGQGTRLGSLSLEIPKPMLPIGGIPLLGHTVAWLRAHGVSRLAINLHHRPRVIEQYLGTGEQVGVSVVYSYEPKLLGTAGALTRLRTYLDETFMVVYGDVFTNLDLSRLVDLHRTRSAEPDHPGLATLALYRVSNPSACGLVELDAAQRVTRFVEKPPPEEVFTDLASAGVIVFEPGVLDCIPDDQPSDIGRDLIPALLRQGLGVYGDPLRPGEFLVDIGTPSSYQRAEELFEAQAGLTAPRPVVQRGDHLGHG